MPARTGTEASTLVLEGPLTFQTIHAHRDAIMKSMGSSGDLTIDLSGVESIDLAGAQLLVAVHRSLAARNASLRVTHAERYRRICGFAGIQPLGAT